MPLGTQIANAVRNIYGLAIVALLAAAAQGFLGPAAQASTPPPWAFTVSGDFNGDGKVDIAQFDSTTGQWWVALSNGSSFTNSLWAKVAKKRKK